MKQPKYSGNGLIIIKFYQMKVPHGTGFQVFGVLGFWGYKNLIYLYYFINHNKNFKNFSWAPKSY